MIASQSRSSQREKITPLPLGTLGSFCCYGRFERATELDLVDPPTIWDGIYPRPNLASRFSMNAASASA